MDMNIMERSEAIRHFQSDFMDPTQVVASSTKEPATATAGEEIVRILDGKEANPALVYPPKKKSQSAIVKDTHDKEKPEDHKNASFALPTAKANETEDDFKVVRESWRTYGATEVECLQLTDMETGQSEIVAVAPYNHFLVSLRSLELKDHSKATSVSLGFNHKLVLVLEEHHNNSLGQEDMDNEATTVQQSTRHDNTTAASRKADTAASTSSNALPEDDGSIMGTGGSIRESLTSAYQFGVRTAAFSNKLVQKMEENAGTLYNTLQDDFLGRTVASGKRIVGYMPKTAQAVSKTVKQLMGYDDPSGDDDHPRGPQGPGGAF